MPAQSTFLSLSFHRKKFFLMIYANTTFSLFAVICASPNRAAYHWNTWVDQIHLPVFNFLINNIFFHFSLVAYFIFHRSNFHCARKHDWFVAGHQRSGFSSWESNTDISCKRQYNKVCLSLMSTLLSVKLSIWNAHTGIKHDSYFLGFFCGINCYLCYCFVHEKNCSTDSLISQKPMRGKRSELFRL